MRSKDFTPGAGPKVTELALGRKAPVTLDLQAAQRCPRMECLAPSRLVGRSRLKTSIGSTISTRGAVWSTGFTNTAKTAMWPTCSTPIEIALDWYRFHVEEEQ